MPAVERLSTCGNPRRRQLHFGPSLQPREGWLRFQNPHPPPSGPKRAASVSTSAPSIIPFSISRDRRTGATPSTAAGLALHAANRAASTLLLASSRRERR